MKTYTLTCESFRCHDEGELKIADDGAMEVSLGFHVADPHGRHIINNVNDGSYEILCDECGCEADVQEIED